MTDCEQVGSRIGIFKKGTEDWCFCQAGLPISHTWYRLLPYFVRWKGRDSIKLLSTTTRSRAVSEALVKDFGCVRVTVPAFFLPKSWDLFSGTGHTLIYPLLLHKLRPEAKIVATGKFLSALLKTWHRKAYPSEIDAVSFHHSVKTRQNNSIPPASISILRPSPEQPILFPIFDSISTVKNAPAGNEALVKPITNIGDEGGWDFVICNPPFFGSEEEMKDGQTAKTSRAHAVRSLLLWCSRIHTSSCNQLIF